MLLHRRVAFAHQGADRSRRGVEDIDLVPLDHVPESREIRVIGHAFEHQGGGAVGERAVDDVAMAGDPADVGSAPEKLSGAIIEHIMKSGRGPHRIAAGGVEHALGLAGRSRRIEYEERVLGSHWLAWTLVRHGRTELVVPMVAALPHLDRIAEMADDDHAGDSLP